jgi:outer membrane usher protein
MLGALPLVALALAAGPPSLASDLSDLSAEAETAATDGSAITPRTNETLQLAVVVNGRPMGMIGEFVVQRGQLFARRDELLSLGLRVPTSVRAEGDLIALGGVAGFAARVDQATQTIYITADNDWLAPTVLGEEAPSTDYSVEGNIGATLNYDLIAKSADGQAFANGALDFRAFSSLGVLSSGMLFYASSDSRGHGGGAKATRLDTSYVYSDPVALRRYRAGDLITGGLPWTRPVRLGGAQVDHDFSMRPDLITFPVPQVVGSAAVPSTVDVLVNNQPVLSGAVPSGPFSVPAVPVISGSGTVTTTVTDALGRQVVTETPFYATAALLSPGLHTYSGEIGFVRRNWGTRNADYGDVAGSATYRRGLSDYFTIEAHAEATKGLAMAGVGGVANLFDFAVASIAVAGSIGSGQSGWQIAAGFERLDSVVSFGASVIAADRHFGDIAKANGDAVTKMQLNVHAGLSLSRLGSLGLAYVDNDKFRPSRIGPPPLVPPPAVELLHTQIVTGSYSRQIGPMSFYATAFRSIVGKQNTTGLFGLAMPLGRRATVSVGANATKTARSAQVDLSQSAIVPGDWGFHAFASIDGQPTRNAPWIGDVADHEFAQATYKAQWGQVYAGADRTGARTTVQGELIGAVSVIDNGVFFSNWINDSFAVVDTGMPGIIVRQENRDIARTDSHGRAVVPDLLAFELNQISINPLDAPVDADIALTGRGVRPPDRSGVVVKLPVRAAHGAVLRIVDASGAPLPVGSAATLSSTKVAVPVGYEGEAYLLDLQAHNTVTIELPDGRRCALAFDYEAKAGDIPSIGPIVCRETAP